MACVKVTKGNGKTTILHACIEYPMAGPMWRYRYQWLYGTWPSDDQFVEVVEGCCAEPTT